MINYRKVMGYNFVSNTMNEFVDEIHSRITDSEKTFIVTANPEIVSYANSNSSYGTILNNADYIIPDGIGIIMASKLLGKPLQERLTGFDLMEMLLQLANKNGLSIYLLGAKPQVIDLTAENIQKKYPNLNLVGYHHGYFNQDDEKIVNEIKEKSPDLVLVGLGYPKQEQWISEHLSQFDKGIFIGIGGCFDIWAGSIKRAPKIWRNLNVEWLYRLIKEPSRLKRDFAIPIFMINVLNNKYRSK